MNKINLTTDFMVSMEYKNKENHIYNYIEIEKCLNYLLNEVNELKSQIEDKKSHS